MLDVSHAVANELLFLSVTINDAPIEGLIQVKKSGEHFYIASKDAEKFNLAVQTLPVENDTIDFSTRPGLDITYDALQQSLAIRAAAKWLSGSQSLNDPRTTNMISEESLSPEVTGVALDYDFYTNHDNQSQTFSAWSELRTFGLGKGYFSSSFNTRQSYYNNASSAGNGTQRLMSSWHYDDVDNMRSLTLGDSYTSAQSWSNSVRFGGISWSHNYAVQPNFNTSSQDILSSTATLPSTVDLYIQGIKTASQQVRPGEFTLNTAPFFTGSSNAQVVITDINGQQRTVNLDLYGSNMLLSRGLNTWSLNAGWVRQEYATRSFSYNSDLMMVGDWRYGLDDKLTLEAHAEQGAPLQNAGVGANYLPSPVIGVLHTDLSWGRDGDESGTQWGVSWQWNNQRFNTSFSHIQRESGFRDISVLADGSLASRANNAFVSWSFDQVGTFGLSWIARKYATGSTQYGGLSWSDSFKNQVSIAASFTQSLEDAHNRILYLNLTIPFGERHYLSAQSSSGGSENSRQIMVARTLAANEPGWGYEASQQMGHNAMTHVSVQRRTRWSDWGVGYNRYQRQNNYFATASGALGLLAGHVYATRELGDAFALVDTAGVPDIPVYLEHRYAGKTDADGMLFLNNLNAWQDNTVTLNVLSLPEDYRAPYTEQRLIPRQGGGAIAQFSLYRTRALLLKATRRDGRVLPFAAKVDIVTASGETPAYGTAQTVVGYEGNIYLEDPPVSGRVNVSWREGRCQIPLPTRPLQRAMVAERAQCQ